MDFDTDAFKTTKDTFGRLDIVVNNAGIANEMDHAWERCVFVNLVSISQHLALGPFEWLEYCLVE